MRNACALCLIGLISVSSWASTAHAQPAGADVLFDQGRSLKDAGKFAEAAVKFEESQRLDPAVGTLLNLAECYTALGRTASAWTTYRAAASAAAQSKQSQRERFASDKASQLEPQLTRLSISVINKPAGMQLTRDGVVVPEALWGSPVPVDPGSIRVEASAPGFRSWSTVQSVEGAGKTTKLVIPDLEALPVADSGSLPAGTDQSPATDPSPSGPDPEEETEPPPPEAETPVWGWVTLAIGGLGAGIGTYLYVDAQATIDDANCPNERCVVGIGDKALHDDGRSQEKLGLGVGVVGLALVGIGLYAVLTAEPDSGRSGPTARRDQPWYQHVFVSADTKRAGVSWSGAF